jgi:hypothetical protein
MPILYETFLTDFVKNVVHFHLFGVQQLREAG